MPLSSAVPVAVVPSGNVTVTVDPGSAVPPIVVSSLVTSFTVGAVVSVTVIVNVVSVLLPFTSVVTTVTGYSPTSLGLPLIVFVSGSKVTPSGKPLTSLVTGLPLLSSL